MGMDSFEVFGSSKSRLGTYGIFNLDLGLTNLVAYYEESRDLKLSDDYNSWKLSVRLS